MINNLLCSTDPNPKWHLLSSCLFLDLWLRNRAGFESPACYARRWHTILWGLCHLSLNIIPTHLLQPSWKYCSAKSHWGPVEKCYYKLKMHLQGLTPVNETREVKNKGKIVLDRGAFSPLYKYWPLQAQMKSMRSFYYGSACLKSLVCITQWVCYYLSFFNLKQHHVHEIKNNVWFESIYFAENCKKFSIHCGKSRLLVGKILSVFSVFTKGIPDCMILLFRCEHTKNQISMIHFLKEFRRG